MNAISLPTRSRIIGLNLLVIFVIGIAIYQFLRGPYAFSDQFETDMVANSSSIHKSVILAYINGCLSLANAILLYPLFKKASHFLAPLYLLFCGLNFVGIALENQAVLALLEASSQVNASEISQQAYDLHRRAHLTYLLISCLPVATFFFICLIEKFLPKWLSIFGLVAAIIMAIDITSSLLGYTIPFDLLIPIGLVQLLLPFWLMIKGFKKVVD